MDADRFRRKRAVVAILAWGAFVGAWWFVGTRPGAVLVTWQLLVLPVSVLLVTLVTAYWVRHNRQIYVRKGPRRGVPVVREAHTHDRLAQPLSIDLPAMRLAREVVVDVDATGKRFWAAP